ncbi:hypothetical protein NDU88_001893 [Pleurodeles waltl]|uniref:Uncharacterized protein n=1 Tax=Pleurodeles waltl TaxID=8319 RepID=A0AAV7LIT6_PLEWA|nr:hypothetical protein NDU88_001893 [Pleurodeles waltl]
MQHRFRCHRAEGLQCRAAVSGPHYTAVEMKRRQMRSQSLGSSRFEVQQSHNAAGQPLRVTMMSQSRRRCDSFRSSRTLDL